METANSTEFIGDEKPKGFPVVGIGASAGGIQALKEFFEHVPDRSAIAYVVILHLSPDHDSKLADILQSVTNMRVVQVLAKTKIEPDQVYVVPPNQHLVITDGYIAPSENLNVEDRRAPVDIFFRNLADSIGPRAVGVVLSGTGANGSMGLKRINERGGVVYVQSPREAEFNEMPRHAIATELVDEVLQVAAIPGKIIAYRNSIGSVQIILEPRQLPEEQQQALREIFAQLRIRTGHDFTNYKRPTLLRRIERRINLRNLPDLPSYSAYLQQNADEAHALLKDLLISVTNFFRDRKAFECMDQDLLTKIFAGKRQGEDIRIWVVGCATGEEAYSLAILCAEHSSRVPTPPAVQIFATDIDHAALNTAREGYYTLNDVADVSPDRLRQFFNKNGEGYRVCREIKEMILFAKQNFLKDPPFSKLDLISCRNVMIYLNTTAQERAVETFQFALRPQGYLFLGTSETVDSASDLYTIFNREQHIYQSRGNVARSYPIPESVPSFRFEKNDLLQKPRDQEPRNQRLLFGDLHQKMLEQYASPSIVINEQHEIVHMSEQAGKYLELTGGEMSKSLLKNIRPALRLELRTALYQAVQTRTAIDARPVSITIEGRVQSLVLQVRPVFMADDVAKGYILIIFNPVVNGESDKEPEVTVADEPLATRLEEELIQLKSQLRSSTDQHGYQEEELKASNEELLAMNEELRSAAEELETSREELQSINEEMRTVNQELKIKIYETTLNSNNIQNLINSANVGTIFLDRSLSIRLFTPAVLDIFNVKSSDYGRPITDITNKLREDNLLDDAETVLQTLLSVEREVNTTEGKDFMMRLLPYRTAEDRINGVVITFFDITMRKQSEEALRQSEQYLRLILESATDYAIFTFDTERRIVRWNGGAQKVIGYSQLEINAQPVDILFTPEDREQGLPEKEKEMAEREGRVESEGWYVRKGGHRFWASGYVGPLRDNEGNLIGFVKIMRDLTERKKNEALRLAEETDRIKLETEAQKRNAELYKSANLLQQAEEVAGMGSWEYEIASGEFHCSPGMYKLFHLAPEEVIIPDIYVQIATEDCKPLARRIFDAITKGEGPLEETIRCNIKGNEKILRIKLEPVLDEAGNPQRVFGVDVDITAAMTAQATVQEQEHLIQSINQAIPDILFVANLDTNELTYVNHLFEKKLGYEKQYENATMAYFDIMHSDDVEKMRAHIDDMKNAIDGEVREIEYRMKAPDGSLHWFMNRNTVFKRASNGRAIEQIGIAQNITERKLAEQALKESNTNLQYANENLQQFASIASHDLQEPLRKLRLFGSVLTRYKELPDDAIELIGKIRSTSERMSQLITEVLQYSKMAYGVKEFVHVELHSIFDKVLVDLDLRILETGAIILYSEPLPDIDAIPPQINQLFYNLLVNALKFQIADAAPVVEVSWRNLPANEVRNIFALHESKSYIEIIISDNGIGFNEAYAEQIFQIFERLHSLDEFEGTGIGLALCKKIVENHHGHIYAISNERKGAAFHVILPTTQNMSLQNKGNLITAKSNT